VLQFEGDSITASAPQATSYVGLTAVGYHPVTLQNSAVSGSYVSDVVARESADNAYLSATKPNILSVYIGINNLDRGDSAASIFAQLKSYGQTMQAAGWKVVMATQLPCNFGTCVNGGCETERLALNTLIRNDSSFYNALADIAQDPIMGNLANVTNLLYFDSFGIHPTNPLGHSLIAPYFETAVSSLFH
jgi:hypothetical protein